MKRRKQTFIWRTLILLGVIVFSAIIIEQFNIILKNNALLSQLERELQEKEMALLRLDDLKELYSSPEHIEKVARERLGLVFPHEKIFIDKSRIAH